MADTINVTIRLERDIKESAENLFNEFGMNLSTAFNIFVRQTLRQGKIPFEIYDPFYSKENQAELMHRARDVDLDNARLTVHELIEADDDYSLV